MNVVTPSAADIAAFKAASASVGDDYKAKAGALGAQLLEAARILTCNLIFKRPPQTAASF